MGNFRVHWGLTSLQEQLRGLDFAEPVICAGARRHSLWLSSNAWQPGRRSRGNRWACVCVKGRPGDSHGGRRIKGQAGTAEMAEAFLGWEEGKGRRRLGEGS